MIIEHITSHELGEYRQTLRFPSQDLRERYLAFYAKNKLRDIHVNLDPHSLRCENGEYLLECSYVDRHRAGSGPPWPLYRNGEKGVTMPLPQHLEEDTKILIDGNIHGVPKGWIPYTDNWAKITGVNTIIGLSMQPGPHGHGLKIEVLTIHDEIVEYSEREGDLNVKEYSPGCAGNLYVKEHSCSCALRSTNYPHAILGLCGCQGRQYFYPNPALVKAFRVFEDS